MTQKRKFGILLSKEERAHPAHKRLRKKNLIVTGVMALTVALTVGLSSILGLYSIWGNSWFFVSVILPIGIVAYLGGRWTLPDKKEMDAWKKQRTPPK